MSVFKSHSNFYGSLINKKLKQTDIVFEAGSEPPVPNKNLSDENPLCPVKY